MKVVTDDELHAYEMTLTEQQANILRIILDRGWGELRRDIRRIEWMVGALLGFHLAWLLFAKVF